MRNLLIFGLFLLMVLVAVSPGMAAREGHFGGHFGGGHFHHFEGHFGHPHVFIGGFYGYPYYGYPYWYYPYDYPYGYYPYPPDAYAVPDPYAQPPADSGQTDNAAPGQGF